MCNINAIVMNKPNNKQEKKVLMYPHDSVTFSFNSIATVIFVFVVAVVIVVVMTVAFVAVDCGCGVRDGIVSGGRKLSAKTALTSIFSFNTLYDVTKTVLMRSNISPSYTDRAVLVRSNGSSMHNCFH